MMSDALEDEVLVVDAQCFGYAFPHRSADSPTHPSSLPLPPRQVPRLTLVSGSGLGTLTKWNPTVSCHDDDNNDENDDDDHNDYGDEQDQNDDNKFWVTI